MADIFISYQRDDAEQANRLAATLTAAGYAVWIDSAIQAGKVYDRQIEDALAASGCVVVLWSKHSVESEWVRAEAETAYVADKLVPLFLDRTRQPVRYTLVQGIEFAQWDGAVGSPEFLQLVNAINRRLGRAPAETAATLSNSEGTPAYRRLAQRLGLAFADPTKERRFAQFYAKLYTSQLRFGLVLVLVLYVLLAALDAVEQTVSPDANRFRLIFVAPALGLVVAVGFMPMLMRFWRFFSLAFSLLAMLLIVWTLHTVRFETAWLKEGALIVVVLGAAITVVTALPLRTPDTALVVLVPVATSFLVPMLFETTTSQDFLASQCIVAGAIVAVTVAWWRERFARRLFDETR